jgi:hypothetical protein
MAEVAGQDPPWFWDLLESSARSLRALCRRLEELPQEQLRRYKLLYDKWKGEINPHAWEECHPYLAEDCSEDHADDFAAWVVMQGSAFYDEVAAHPELIQHYLGKFARAEAERRSGQPGAWDNEVDRPEYRGYQRPDYIPSPIYRMRFGEDLDEACYDQRGWPSEEV